MCKRAVIVFFGIFSICSSALSREIPSGIVEIAGDFNIIGVYQKSARNDGYETDLNGKYISSLLSYYFLKNIAVGVNMVYSSAKYDYSDGSVSEYSENTIGPQITYNFDISEQVNLKIFGAYLKYSSSGSYTDIIAGDVFEGESKYSGSGWSAGMGVETYLSNDITLNLKFERRKLSIDIEDSSGSENETENLGTLGFSIYLH